MAENIGIEIVSGRDIEVCRELCNELMDYQKSQATIAREAFDKMDFDTRMRKSYTSAAQKQVLVAKDRGTPVGYVFSTIDMVDEGARALYPEWAPVSESSKGFYPDWLKLPQKIGCLNNLYVRDAYRGVGLGSKLFSLSMEWLESFPDCRMIFVYISNGNNAAYKFYLKNGFTFSHDVFGGFIKAAYKNVR